MNRPTVTAFALLILSAMTTTAWAAGDDAAMALVDKGIASLGGDKVAHAAGYEVEYEVKRNFQGNENTMYGFMVVKGVDHAKTELEGEFNGNEFLSVNVIAGDKGWTSFGDNPNLDGDRLARQKRQVYLQVIPTLLTPLKTDAFKVASAGDADIDGKPAAKLTVTGPDGGTFDLYLEKETGLPLKTVSVNRFQDQERTLETFYSDYKDFDGVKKAVSVKTPGEGFFAQDQTVKKFKLLTEVSDDHFKQP